MPRRRNESISLADIEGATDPADVPGVMPPPGVEANIKTEVRYNRTIQPQDIGPYPPEYDDGLRELAASEIDDGNLPEPEGDDPCSEFLDTWRRFAGYHMKVIRLPDPASNLLSGNTFNRSCRDITMLGVTTFEPLAFEESLRAMSGNSGGVFRVMLLDHNGSMIEGARLDRVLISDPPRRASVNRYDDDDDPRARRYVQQPPPPPTQPPAPPEPSPFQRRMEELQTRLLENALERAANPPQPSPFAGLSDQDRLAMSLLQQGDLLPQIVNRIASLAQAPEKLEQPATWKDKLGEAAIEMVTHNPQVVERVTDIVTRTAYAITNALVAGFGRGPVMQQPQPQPLPPAAIQQAPAYAGPLAPDLPETPQEDDDPGFDDDDETYMIEDITKLLLSTAPLSLSDPIVTNLRNEYPKQFDLALGMIAKMPPTMVLQYIAQKSEFAADMINSPVTGPHLKNRLHELRDLIRNSLPAPIREQLEAEEKGALPTPDSAPGGNPAA